MKQISKINFLIRYTLGFIGIHLTLVILLVNYLMAEVYYEETLGSVIVLLVGVFLVPIVSSVSAFALATKNKQIIDDGKNTENQVTIVLLIAAIISYYLAYTVAIGILIAYALSIWVCYIMLMRKVKNKIATEQNEDVRIEYNRENFSFSQNNTTNTTNNSIIKQYQLRNLDDESIVEFLQINSLSENPYFFATQMAGLGDYALYGKGASFTQTNCIVTFDKSQVYLFELSKMSNKKIVNCIHFPMQEIKQIQAKNFLGMAFRLHIIFQNKKKIILQANKKISSLKYQEENIQKFIDLVNKY